MKTLLSSFLLLFLSTLAYGQASFFQEADAFFGKYVKNGSVDYTAVSKNRSDLQSLVDQIARQNLNGVSAENKKAFYINAYNLLVIRQIIESYPVDGPQSIPGFFDKNEYVVAGQKINLNNLENIKIRLPYKDPRIHFALVCAAKGCPEILDRAYLPETLDSQLEEQTRYAINNPVFIQRKGEEVLASQIFKWYATDFGGETQILPFIKKYHRDPKMVGKKLSFYEYNWKLNDAR